MVVGNADAIKRLESIVHPMLRSHQQEFLDAAKKAGAPVAVLDIPLLYETGGHDRVDAVVVVTTSPEVQRARILARANMTADKLDAILNAPGSRCREAPPRRFRGGYVPRPRAGTAADP